MGGMHIKCGEILNVFRYKTDSDTKWILLQNGI